MKRGMIMAGWGLVATISIATLAVKMFALPPKAAEQSEPRVATGYHLLLVVERGGQELIAITPKGHVSTTHDGMRTECELETDACALALGQAFREWVRGVK